jgi:hypothetical protein
MGIVHALKKLFTPKPVPAPTKRYKDYTVTALARKSKGQFHTCAMIGKTIDGAERKASFIRADRHDSLQQAQEHSFKKAEQIINEQGDSIFNKDRI